MHSKQKTYVVFLLGIISGAFGVIYVDVSNYAKNAFPFERDVKTNYAYAQQALPDLNSTLLFLHTALQYLEPYIANYNIRGFQTNASNPEFLRDQTLRLIAYIDAVIGEINSTIRIPANHEDVIFSKIYDVYVIADNIYDNLMSPPWIVFLNLVGWTMIAMSLFKISLKWGEVADNEEQNEEDA